MIIFLKFDSLLVNVANICAIRAYEHVNGNHTVIEHGLERDVVPVCFDTVAETLARLVSVHSVSETVDNRIADIVPVSATFTEEL